MSQVTNDSVSTFLSTTQTISENTQVPALSTSEINNLIANTNGLQNREFCVLYNKDSQVLNFSIGNTYIAGGVAGNGSLYDLQGTSGVIVDITSGVATVSLEVVPTLTPGSYTNPIVDIDKSGRIIGITNGKQTFISVGGAGIAVSSGNVSFTTVLPTVIQGLLNPTITVDNLGRITAYTPYASGGGIQTVNTTNGLVGGPISVSGTIDLDTSGVVAGTYINPQIDVDSFGRITSAVTNISSSFFKTTQEISVSQTNHGFTYLQPIKFNSLANNFSIYSTNGVSANGANFLGVTLPILEETRLKNLQCDGVVTDIVDANNFKYINNPQVIQRSQFGTFFTNNINTGLSGKNVNIYTQIRDETYPEDQINLGKFSSYPGVTNPVYNQAYFYPYPNRQDQGTTQNAGRLISTKEIGRYTNPLNYPNTVRFSLKEPYMSSLRQNKYDFIKNTTIYQYFQMMFLNVRPTSFRGQAGDAYAQVTAARSAPDTIYTGIDERAILEMVGESQSGIAPVPRLTPFIIAASIESLILLSTGLGYGISQTVVQDLQKNILLTESSAKGYQQSAVSAAKNLDEFLRRPGVRYGGDVTVINQYNTQIQKYSEIAESNFNSLASLQSKLTLIQSIAKVIRVVGTAAGILGGIATLVLIFVNLFQGGLEPDVQLQTIPYMDQFISLYSYYTNYPENFLFFNPDLSLGVDFVPYAKDIDRSLTGILFPGIYVSQFFPARTDQYHQHISLERRDRTVTLTFNKINIGPAINSFFAGQFEPNKGIPNVYSYAGFEAAILIGQFYSKTNNLPKFPVNNNKDFVPTPGFPPPTHVWPMPYYGIQKEYCPNTTQKFIIPVNYGGVDSPVSLNDSAYSPVKQAVIIVTKDGFVYLCFDNERSNWISGVNLYISTSISWEVDNWLGEEYPFYQY